MKEVHQLQNQGGAWQPVGNTYTRRRACAASASSGLREAQVGDLIGTLVSDMLQVNPESCRRKNIGGGGSWDNLLSLKTGLIKQ